MTGITSGNWGLAFKAGLTSLATAAAVGPGGTTYYLSNGAVLAERVAGSGGSVQWNHYLVAGGQMVGMHVEKSDETVATRYFHKDHLGSIAIITDEAGAVVERLA